MKMFEKMYRYNEVPKTVNFKSKTKKFLLWLITWQHFVIECLILEISIQISGSESTLSGHNNRNCYYLNAQLVVCLMF